MEVEIRNKIVRFIKKNGGKATSSEVAQHLKIDKNKASDIMVKLQHKWRDLEALGMNGKSRIFGIRGE